MLLAWPLLSPRMSKRKRIFTGSESVTDENHNTHTKISWQTYWWVSQMTTIFINNLFIYFLFYFFAIWRPLVWWTTPTIAKEILTREKQSFTVSVLPSRCAVWPLEILRRPEVHKGYMWNNWNCCAGNVLTAEQTDGRTDGNWMSIAQCCYSQSVQYMARYSTVSIGQNLMDWICCVILQYQILTVILCDKSHSITVSCSV
jgi:hypothetical protein